jgi:hypothetical protein
MLRFLAAFLLTTALFFAVPDTLAADSLCAENVACNGSEPCSGELIGSTHLMGFDCCWLLDLGTVLHADLCIYLLTYDDGRTVVVYVIETEWFDAGWWH